MYKRSNFKELAPVLCKRTDLNGIFYISFYDDYVRSIQRPINFSQKYVYIIRVYIFIASNVLLVYPTT